MAGDVFKQCSLSSMKEFYFGYFLTALALILVKHLKVFSTVQFKIQSD